MSLPLDDALLNKIEVSATNMARGAGVILNRHFGKPLTIEYKDKARRDPVTSADKESQEFLKQAIAGAFPNHGILSEEDDEENSPVPDFLWVLDPLDGTKNFLSGLPVYACSVGVLYQGVPIAGAVYIPWPCEDGGVVFHARKEGGCFMNQEPVSIHKPDEPTLSPLVTLPSSFGKSYRFRDPTRSGLGELRVTGSIAYELVMAAKGVARYTIVTNPHLWDVAGGSILIQEAAGSVMLGHRTRGLRGLLSTTLHWEQLDSFFPHWMDRQISMREARLWSHPLFLGTRRAVQDITANIKTDPLPRLLMGRK